MSDWSFRVSLYRVLFGLAALYNIGLGMWMAFWPSAFFNLFELPIPTQLVILQCLGMMLGLYGIGYGYAALFPERGAIFILIGLLGKILGPIVWAFTVSEGAWPLRTFTFVALNDLIWWVPFICALRDLWRPDSAAKPTAWPAYFCALLNFLASLILVTLLRPGMEVVSEAAPRIAYIQSHRWGWSIGWGFWMAAGVSLVCFYVWWASLLARRNVSYGYLYITVLVAGVGVVFDWMSESIYIGFLPEVGASRFSLVADRAMLFTGFIANGLYCASGLILSILSLRAGLIVDRLALWGFATWGTGFILAGATLFHGVTIMAISTAMLMLLFCPWVARIGYVLSRRILQS